MSCTPINSKICSFFLKGTCKKGIDCRFLHVRHDRRIFQPAPPWDGIGTPKSATPECTFYMKGRCTKGNECKFSHARKPFFGSMPTLCSPRSTDDCKFFLQGKCSKGNQCRFNHPFRRSEGDDLPSKRVQSIKWNNKQLRLSNLGPDISERDIKNFLQELCQLVPKTIKFSHDNSNAMVGFQENIDFEGLKSEIESEKSLQYLKGRKIEIHEVPFCKCILLWGIPIETSQIDIKDALLHIMGPDSIDDIDYSEGAEYAIITFKQTDLRKLRSADISVGRKKLSYYFFDKNFITSDIYRIIHGKTKSIKLMAGKEILHHLISKRRKRLREIFSTSDFDVDEKECYVVVKMENWNSAAEEKIRDEFEKLISQYDSTAIIVSPGVLNISRHDCLELCEKFMEHEPGKYVTVRLEQSKLFITGKRNYVKTSVGRFEKMKADKQELEKERMQSSSMENCANDIVRTYPMFSKESIKNWLKTDPSLSGEETVSKIITHSRTYSEKNELAFFQTEAFSNCRHRILGECHVLLTAKRKVQRGREGVVSEIFVGDVSTLKCDVIVNSCTSVVGHGGDLARSLSAAGGSEYAQACRKLRDQTIDRWDFKVTTGGNLECRAVIHANLGSYDSKKLIKLLTNILEDAVSKSHCSVAIPMIGTGALHYAKDDVAMSLAKSIEWFNTTYLSSSLKKVIIAVEENDDEAKRAVRKYFPENSQASVGQESVEVTFLGVDLVALMRADSLLQTCCNEHIVATGISNEAISLPTTWSNMPLDAHGKEVPFHLVSLSSFSSEYRTVESEVQRTSQGKINQIVYIQRIQNPQLYMTYMIRKQAMEKGKKLREYERSLFHGTSKESSEVINHHGFSRSYAGTHAAAYGNGNYFAVNSSYSVSYAKPNIFGHRYMYLAKVLVGEFTQGKQGMKAPPKKGTGTDLYDSVVDNCHNPSIFVVFPDNQAYPEYLICFK